MNSLARCIMKRSNITLLFALLLTACGAPFTGVSTSVGTPAPTKHAATGTPTTMPTPSLTAIPSFPTVTPGCGHPLPVPVGTTAQETVTVDPQVNRGATTRTYLLHVPTDYQPQLPLPLVLIFHGRGSNAAEIEHYTGFSQLADRERFLALYPQGLQNAGGQTFWDSFDPPTAGIDEVAFVKRVLDDAEQKLCIDTHRIDATGFSNGGNMTGMLACRLAGRIAAFAPIAGNFFDFRQGCHPGRPVALLNSHGTADEVVPYTARPDVQQWLQGWAQQDGCTVGPVLFSQVAAVSALQWTNCQADVAIFHYRVEGERHIWPQTLGNFPASETIWRFFLAYPLP